MRLIFLFSVIIFLSSCSKPKTVLICGNHVCVNKTEAEQYFEENLSIEVKIIDKNIKEEIKLVELNLKQDSKGNRKVNIINKETTNKDLKVLSNEDIFKIKKDIKNNTNKKKIAKRNIKKKKEIFINNKKLKSKNDKLVKKVVNKKDKNKKNTFIIDEKYKSKKNSISKKDVNKKQKDIVDVCTKIEKCSIDEIAKYLLKIGKKRDFPDITIRQ